MCVDNWLKSLGIHCLRYVRCFCLSEAILKNQWGQREGVKSGYRTKGLITLTGLCRDPGTLVKRNKNQLCDYITTKPVRLAGIPVFLAGMPGGNFPSNHACRAARRMNQARNRTAGNTLFMCIASTAHVIRSLLWVCRFRGSCRREYDVILLTQGY